MLCRYASGFEGVVIIMDLPPPLSLRDDQWRHLLPATLRQLPEDWDVLYLAHSMQSMARVVQRYDRMRWLGELLSPRDKCGRDHALHGLFAYAVSQRWVGIIIIIIIINIITMTMMVMAS
jgi:hypothetical protein